MIGKQRPIVSLGASLHYLVHHHNCQRFTCPCGVLHAFHWIDTDAGDHFELTCTCGRKHGKAKKSFSGDGPNWAPRLRIAPMMTDDERHLLELLAAKRRRVVGPLYTLALMLEQRGYLNVLNATVCDVTDAGRAAVKEPSQEGDSR